jgi:hypothetical protein
MFCRMHLIIYIIQQISLEKKVVSNEFNNVVETYLAMQKSKGVTVAEALKAACEATGRSFNKKYQSKWPLCEIAIPEEVSAWMQAESAYFAFEMAGARVSREKASSIAKSLSTPVTK